MTYWTSMDENERYRFANHFSPTQRQKIESQDRLPYSMPFVANKLIPISVEQRKSRTKYKVKDPVGFDDAVKASIATVQLNHVCRRSRTEEIESDVFDQGLFIKFGARDWFVDDSKHYTEIKDRILDYRQVVWDLNAVRYDLGDKLFAAKLDKEHRYVLDQRYGTNVLDDTAEGVLGSWSGRDKTTYYVKENPNDLNELDIITKFTHYQKVTRKKYVLIFHDKANALGGNIEEQHETLKEARLRAVELDFQYSAQGFSSEFFIEEAYVNEYDKYVFVYNKILEFEETSIPADIDRDLCPISIFFAIFMQGEFISMLDFMKSPQQFLDRLWAQMDFSLGKDIKDTIQGNPQLLADNETPETAAAKLQKGGGIIWTKTQPGQDVFSSLKGQGLNPQYMQLSTILQGYLEDLGGGRSFQGLAEGKNESGVSVEKKQQAGAAVAYTFLDNFSRHKRNHGEKLLWAIGEYETDEKLIAVHGTELKPAQIQLLMQSGVYQASEISKNAGSITVNKGGVSYLKNSALELLVSEDEFSDTQREKSLAYSLKAAEVMPEIRVTRIFQEKVLSGIGYDFDEVQEMMQELDMMRQQQAQQAEFDQKKGVAEMLMKNKAS